MAEDPTKLPAKTEIKAQAPSLFTDWRPFDSFRNEMERMFDDFGRGFWRVPSGRALFDAEPFFRRSAVPAANPVVDVVETDKAYEITAELPGLDEKDIDVKLANGTLTIKGEKKEEKEEKKKDYHLTERRYGSFQRAFLLPDGVDAEKIAATFDKGVLKIALPKTAQAQTQEKKIAINNK